MKKILHIQVFPKLSGAQKISLEIFKGLPNEDYQKWVLFSEELNAGDREQCENAFQEVGVKVIYSRNMKRSIGFKDIAATVEIYRLCRREKFDIVHTHSTKPGIIGRVAATMACVPMVIHTVHGLSFHKFVKFPLWQFYWACEMFASMFCDKIILVNKYYSKYFGWFNQKVSTIYNGIDFAELPQFEKNENAPLKILFVGRLDTQKDPITILHAAQIVLQKHPNVRFTLVGDGEKYEECKDFITQNNLQCNISLEGWRNNVAQYYATHDIFVAPSIYEAFGLMFVEAGYYRLPCVTTNVEGIPEVVEDNQTGLLSSPKDAHAMAANIIELVENKERRESMAEAAYERVCDLFSAERMAMQYKQVYSGGESN